jgi:hypothetical protein
MSYVAYPKTNSRVKLVAGVFAILIGVIMPVAADAGLKTSAIVRVPVTPPTPPTPPNPDLAPVYGVVSSLENPNIRISEAKIVARIPQTGKVVAKTTSDESGNYRLKVNTGYYMITASHEGYYSNTQSIFVPQRTFVRLDLPLTPIAKTNTAGFGSLIAR